MGSCANEDAQYFSIVDRNGEYFKLYNELTADCVAMPEFISHHVDDLKPETCEGAEDRKFWSLDDNTGGQYFRLKNKKHEKCLTLNVDFSSISMQECDFAENKYWSFEEDN